MAEAEDGSPKIEPPKSVAAVVLGLINHVKDRAGETWGADPTPYIHRISENRKIHREMIRMLCAQDGEAPEPHLDLFDRRMDELFTEYNDHSHQYQTASSPAQDYPGRKPDRP